MRRLVFDCKLSRISAHAIVVELASQSCLIRFQFLGFSVTDRACCGIGRNAGEITCLPFERPCANRNEYVFWDAFHPTAAVNIILARQAFYGSPDVVFPINILQLANLELDPKPWILNLNMREVTSNTIYIYGIVLLFVSCVSTSFVREKPNNI